METDLHITETQYNLLLSVYSVPNVILPMVGGYLVTKVGIRNVLIFTTFIIFLSSVIIWLGSYKLIYNYMLLGRFLFGT